MMVDVLAHGVSAGTTSVPSEGNNLLVLKTVLHVLDGSVDLHALGSTSDFVSVLVVGAKVANSALSSCKREKERGEQESPTRERGREGATVGTE